MYLSKPIQYMAGMEYIWHVFLINFIGKPGKKTKLVFSISLENEARYYGGGSTGWWNLGDSPDGTSQMVDEVLKASLMPNTAGRCMMPLHPGRSIISMTPAQPQPCAIMRLFRTRRP